MMLKLRRAFAKLTVILEKCIIKIINGQLKLRRCKLDCLLITFDTTVILLRQT